MDIFNLYDNFGNKSALSKSNKLYLKKGDSKPEIIGNVEHLIGERYHFHKNVLFEDIIDYKDKSIMIPALVIYALTPASQITFELPGLIITTNHDKAKKRGRYNVKSDSTNFDRFYLLKIRYWEVLHQPNFSESDHIYWETFKADKKIGKYLLKF